MCSCFKSTAAFVSYIHFRFREKESPFFRSLFSIYVICWCCYCTLQWLERAKSSAIRFHMCLDAFKCLYCFKIQFNREPMCVPFSIADLHTVFARFVENWIPFFSLLALTTERIIFLDRFIRVRKKNTHIIRRIRKTLFLLMKS